MPKLPELLTESDRQFYLTGEFTRERAADIWFCFCDRLAYAVNQTNLSPEETLNFCLSLWHHLFEKLDFPHGESLARTPQYWRDYLAKVDRGTQHLGLPESAIRNIVLHDLLYADLIYIYLNITSNCYNDNNLGPTGHDRVAKLDVEGGAPLLLWEEYTQNGFVKYPLRQVGRIAHIRIIADEDVNEEAADYWQINNRPVLKDLLDGIRFEDSPWKSGLKTIGTIYLASHFDATYALRPPGGSRENIMISGIRHIVTTPPPLRQKYNPIWAKGVYVHESDHFFRQYLNSLALLESYAEDAARDYHEVCGHTEQANRRKKSADLMISCLLGNIPLSQHPEVAHVIKLNVTANIAHENWQKLFEVFDLLLSSNQWADTPPPPLPPHNLDAIGLPPAN